VKSRIEECLITQNRTKEYLKTKVKIITRLRITNISFDVKIRAKSQLEVPMKTMKQLE